MAKNPYKKAIAILKKHAEKMDDDADDEVIANSQFVILKHNLRPQCLCSFLSANGGPKCTAGRLHSRGLYRVRRR